MPANVQLDDLNLRIKLRRILIGAGRKAGEGLAGYVRQKINVSARTETPASRKARLANAKAKRRRAAKFLYAASKPGEPPRSRTRTLVKSVASNVFVDLRDDSITVRVGAYTPYARHLELGTRKMAPRPYLRPSILEYRERFMGVIRTEVSRRLRSGAL